MTSSSHLWTRTTSSAECPPGGMAVSFVVKAVRWNTTLPRWTTLEVSSADPSDARSQCETDILHVFYTYLKRVQDTFGIHIRYNKIHVSYALP